MYFKRQLLPSGLIPMYFLIDVTVTSLTSCTDLPNFVFINRCTYNAHIVK